MLYTIISNLAALAKNKGYHNGIVYFEFDAKETPEGLLIEGCWKVKHKWHPYRGLFH